MDDASAPPAGADEPPARPESVASTPAADATSTPPPGPAPATVSPPPAPSAQPWTPGGRILPTGRVRRHARALNWVPPLVIAGLLLFGAVLILQTLQAQSGIPAARLPGTATPPALKAANAAGTPVIAGAPVGTPGGSAAPPANATPPAAPTAAPAVAAPGAAILGGSAGLKGPRGVAVDAAGHVFVADSGNSRVVRLDANDTVLGTFGTASKTAGPGNFNVLSDMAITPDGQPVTLDAGNNDVQVFAADGKPSFQAEHVGSSPSGIAVGPDGRIWVADTAGSRIVRLTADGKQDAVFTGSTPQTHFEQPLDVALAPDGTAYAVDLLRRIVRLDAQGQIAQSWPVEIGVNVGGSHLAYWTNRVVWTDPDHNRLGVLDPASGAVRYVGTAGNAPGQFNLPTAIATGPDGKLYVVDANNARVQVFTTLDTK